jgi:hypothetical protein
MKRYSLGRLLKNADWIVAYLEKPVEKGNVIGPLLKRGLEERKCFFDAGCISSVCFVFG